MTTTTTKRPLRESRATRRPVPALAHPARDRGCPSCGGPIDRRARLCRNCATTPFDRERGRAAALVRHEQARENARLAELARAAGLG